LSSTTLQQHNSNISPLANQTNPNENSTNANLNTNTTNLGRSSTTSILTNASINNNTNTTNINSEFDSNKQTSYSSSKLSNASKSKSFSILTTHANNNNNNNNSSNTLSMRRSATIESDATSRRSVQLSNDNFQFEIVDKPIFMANAPPPTTMTTTTTTSNKQNRLGSVSTRPASTISNGSIFSMTSPLLNYLQYGDVLIKCNATI